MPPFCSTLRALYSPPLPCAAFWLPPKTNTKQTKLTYEQRKERVAAKKDEIRAARAAEEE